jgi:hypothetical protein
MLCLCNCQPVITESKESDSRESAPKSGSFELTTVEMVKEGAFTYGLHISIAVSEALSLSLLFYGIQEGCVMVRGIEADSIAFLAGLRPGVFITSIDCTSA